MPYSRKHNFQPGTKISSDQVDEDFDNLITAVNEIEEETKNNRVPYQGADRDLDLNGKKIVNVQWFDTADNNRDGTYYRIGELDNGDFVIRSYNNGVTKDIMTSTKEGFARFPGGQTNVDAHDPPYTSDKVTEAKRWRYTNERVEKQNFNFYTVRHEGRYLKLLLAHYIDSAPAGTQGHLFVDLFDGNDTTIFTTSFTNNNSQANTPATYTIDLGQPTGNVLSFYLRFRSGNASYNVYLRKLRIWVAN